MTPRNYPQHDHHHHPQPQGGDEPKLVHNDNDYTKLIDQDLIQKSLTANLVSNLTMFVVRFETSVKPHILSSSSSSSSRNDSKKKKITTDDDGNARTVPSTKDTQRAEIFLRALCESINQGMRLIDYRSPWAQKPNDEMFGEPLEGNDPRGDHMRLILKREYKQRQQLCPEKVRYDLLNWVTTSGSFQDAIGYEMAPTRLERQFEAMAVYREAKSHLAVMTERDFRLHHIPRGMYGYLFPLVMAFGGIEVDMDLEKFPHLSTDFAREHVRRIMRTRPAKRHQRRFFMAAIYALSFSSRTLAMEYVLVGRYAAEESIGGNDVVDDDDQHARRDQDLLECYRTCVEWWDEHENNVGADVLQALCSISTKVMREMKALLSARNMTEKLDLD